mmetsp:Transcript_20386/g.33746  ORF Transcript_20386/g.33746 Transcript_20386/m.33746 type:complete len:110 (-) Transcript_20386:63-392(-)
MTLQTLERRQMKLAVFAVVGLLEAIVEVEVEEVELVAMILKIGMTLTTHSSIANGTPKITTATSMVTTSQILARLRNKRVVPVEEATKALAVAVPAYLCWDRTSIKEDH